MEVEEEALIVSLRLRNGDFGSLEERACITTLEERLMGAVAEVGQFDGSEMGEGVCALYFYGRSTEELADVVIPILAPVTWDVGSHASKRYGGPGAQEVRIELS
jgi:hypothetical protein